VKPAQMYEELLEIVKRTGYQVRHDRGSFQSGYCVLNEQKLIIFNRTTSVETKTVVLARCLINNNSDDQYIKPAVREFIEKEREIFGKVASIELEVKV